MTSTAERRHSNRPGSSQTLLRGNADVSRVDGGLLSGSHRSIDLVVDHQLDRRHHMFRHAGDTDLRRRDHTLAFVARRIINLPGVLGGIDGVRGRSVQIAVAPDLD